MNLMGVEAKTFKTLLPEGANRNKYLFFGDQLRVGSTDGEQHNRILYGSGKNVADVLVAGSLTIDGPDMVVNGDGSMTLRIEKRDPTAVAEFIKSFPDATGKRIIPRT